MQKKNPEDKFVQCSFLADRAFIKKFELACVKKKSSKSKFIREAITEKIKKEKLY